MNYKKIKFEKQLPNGNYEVSLRSDENLCKSFSLSHDFARLFSRGGITVQLGGMIGVTWVVLKLRLTEK